ncbi:hypothetical protein D3C76_1055190 [compost metagenome]
MLPFIEFTKETVFPLATVRTVDILTSPLPELIPPKYEPELKYNVDIPSLFICKANKLDESGAN